MASDKVWDKLLKIETIGLDENSIDDHHYRYEPTPYPVLEKLADCDILAEGDTLLDYGCGKGRVCFFLTHKTKAKTIGIEYDERIYRAAMENRKTATTKPKSDFVLTSAEEYVVPPKVNRCFFFNPFSPEILQKVMARILESWYEKPREMFLILYYIFDNYASYLMSVNELEYYDEIRCGGDPKNRILIFRLPPY